MSSPTTSVAQSYVHRDKLITPGAQLMFGATRLKWHDVAARETPVEPAVAALARSHLSREAAAGALELKGDLGFVILHRCGAAFYFLIVSTWANENEVWELVFAKTDAKQTDFGPWLQSGPQRATFCVWELGAVWHEQQAWRRYLLSSRDETAKRLYLADTFEGIV